MAAVILSGGKYGAIAEKIQFHFSNDLLAASL